jgi:hypothetical protein
LQLEKNTLNQFFLKNFPDKTIKMKTELN